MFFKIWLTESILIFREKLFRGTCFLLASNTLRHNFFSDENKQLSLKWCCKEKLWQKVTSVYQISKSPFFYRRDDSLMSQYPWNKTNITLTWLSSLYNLFKLYTTLSEFCDQFWMKLWRKYLFFLFSCVALMPSALKIIPALLV